MEFEDRVWQLKEVEEGLVDELITELEITPITAKILANRGYDSVEKVADFLDCDIKKMHDPYLFQDMKAAVERIKQALAEQENIVIYGDYDVDGISSTSLLMKYLKDCGAQVDFYIPNRLEEGYGLNKSAVKSLAEKEIDLMITVDCGIKAHEAVGLANELEIDVIITDHHTVPPQLPEAVAVINPKREDSTYPYAELAGVAVAFKLVQALELSKEEVVMPAAIEYLALVTLGVVADIVPLRDENRIIANEGLEQLQQLSKNEPGLFALAEVTGCLDKEISTGHIAFGLAPRINACGRLGNPDLGVQLFLSSDYEQAQSLAQKLDDLNDQRQEMSQEMQDEAEALIEQLDLEENWILVLASENWHSGVIGNVASDLNEKYYRPVVLIAIEEEGMGKGSARSISGFNIHDALLANQDLLAAFGGHEQAAGLSVAEEKIDLLRDKLNQYAKQELEPQDLIPRQKVDAAVDLEQLSFTLVQELNNLAPFGCANPSPKLIVEEIKISDYKLVGKNDDHLKLTAQDEGLKVDGIAFSQPEAKRKLDLKSENISLLFSPEINCWQGQKSLQLKIKDIKVPLSSKIEQLFARDEEVEEKESDFIAVKRTEFNERQDRIKELKIGERVKLLSKASKDNSYKVVEVLTESDEVLGYLAKEQSSLARKLDVGVEYQAIVAEVFSDENSNYNLCILVKQSRQKEYSKQFARLKEVQTQIENKNSAQVLDYLREELYDNTNSELIEQSITSLLKGESTLSIINASQNKDELSLSFAAWQSLQQNQLVILMYPFKSILEQRFPVITEKLSNLGLQVSKATASIADREAITLQAELMNGDCDLLITTPQFLKTARVDLEKIKSELGLMVIEEIDHFINDSITPSITDLIAKLGSPLLLALTSSVTRTEIAELNKEFNFDNQVCSNYNKAPLKLKDERNIIDKEEYLAQLLLQNKDTVVYVNQPAKTRELAQKLRKENPFYKEEIAFYHQKLSSKEQSIIRNKFVNEELRMLIVTPYLNEVWGLKNIEQVIFYEPGFNSYNFKYLANQAVKSDSGELHLLYQFEEVEKNKKVLQQLLPNRELLKELYIILFKNKNKAGEVTINQQELLYELNSKLNFKLNKEVLINCLNIFVELGLIERIKGKGGKIKLLDKPEQKLDLCSSIRYNECVVLEEVFSYLENLASKEKNEILKSITETYLTTLKGERDIEFSR
ncbi:single-stranded-DNA-specific exonuclease RecJ [Halanaerobacter jeridensis]|uniref:Single-stranded-DNA-specific exonuclease RecJ n=1 Tax=Halanaerobacter jeridensis TaxID=706427 RepID=A0A939BRR0_9FIRM|nr:single-stranded-DNA-specific exonuclease RecJ [Halanaerobacter jeridensis]MBM7556281.1 single-stranded-DNA-specific exonuclease [Halanaerobacter jeridensis]